jgi:hypothetical protein
MNRFILYVVAALALIPSAALADPMLDEGELELWAFGYSVPAGNHTFVNTVPEQANHGFKGNGWGSACLNFVGCGRDDSKK